jgi:hypothetical protein
MRPTFRMTALLLFMAVAIPAPAAVLFDTDFGTAATPIRDGAGKPRERVRGVLPEGWRDNSEWAPVWAECRVREEEGRKFLRCEVTKIESGWFQLVGPPVAGADGESFFRLTVRLRNLSGAPLELGIRMNGEPYKMHWSVKHAFERQWVSKTYDFRLGRIDGPAAFFLLMNGTGTLDLAGLKLERLTHDELAAELKAKHPDGGPANLMRNSRFPLGLQSGWTLGRELSDGDDVQVGPDPEVRGPSGVPALRCRSKTGKRILLRFEPFGVRCPVLPHTAVLSARGEGEWMFSVRAERRLVGKQKVRLTGDWQRIEIPFKPVLLSRIYQWRAEGAGALWLDALQVGPSEKVKAYAPAGECEVALACPAGDAAPARVRFDDEPAEVAWCVSGKVPGASLRGRVVNLYGGSKDLPAVAVGPDFLTRGAFRFDVFPRRPFGSFRIEAWVERGGKRISPVNELVVHRLRRPRYWGKDAPDSPFGTHTLSTTRHILMAKAIGVNWTRFHDAGLEYIGWWNLEPEPGQWRFFDTEIHRFRTHGMKIFAELGTAPRWASYYQGAGRKGFGYFDKFFQPRDLKQYGHYVHTVVKRYKGVIDAWDVWNEPWIHAWWGVAYDNARGGRAGYITSKHPQRDFTDLMRTAYENVKAVDPESIVAGFNSTTGGGGTQSFTGSDWTRGVLEHGGLRWCDFVDYHHYTAELAGPPEDVVAKGLKVAVGPIREKHGKVPKPVWMTEGHGAIGIMGSGFYRHTLPYADEEDVVGTGNRLCRYVVSLLAHDVKRVFLYSMHCHDYFHPAPASWTVFVTQEGSLHPSGAAFSAMAWHLEDTRFVKYVPLAEGVWAAVFQGEGRAVAALVREPGSPAFKVPALAGATARDLLGNPVDAGTPLDEKLVYLTVRGETAAFDGLKAK